MLKILFSSLIEKPKNMCFDGEDNDEKILYVFRRSLVTNFDWLLIAVVLVFAPTLITWLIQESAPELYGALPAELKLIMSLFWGLFIIGYLLVNFLNWFFNVYIVSSKRIVDMDFIGLLHKNISEAPLASVEDVTSQVSGTLRVIFNYGTVFIQTAAEAREFEFTDVAKPAKVRDILSDIVTDVRSGNQQ